MHRLIGRADSDTVRLLRDGADGAPRDSDSDGDEEAGPRTLAELPLTSYEGGVAEDARLIFLIVTAAALAKAWLEQSLASFGTSPPSSKKRRAERVVA